MGQKRYSLSDADMLGIFEAIDNRISAFDIFVYGWSATWNAILAQEGLSLADFTEDSIDPRKYAIPTDQANEITNRMITRARKVGVDNMTITSVIMMEWINVGPASYNAEPRKQKTDDILPPPTNPPIASLVHIPPRNNK